MSFRIVVELAARHDILEAEQYLNDHAGPEVVRRFRSAIATAIRNIRERPRAFSVIWRNVRRAQASPFKYGLFVTLHKDHCNIFAIVDMRRHPPTWQRRR